MKMKTRTILGVLIFFIFISGCSKEVCKSGLYASGECCTYVCDIECNEGYKEGTCNCECKESVLVDGGEDTNIEDIFDDGGDIKPPGLPSP